PLRGRAQHRQVQDRAVRRHGQPDPVRPPQRRERGDRDGRPAPHGRSLRHQGHAGQRRRAGKRWRRLRGDGHFPARRHRPVGRGSELRRRRHCDDAAAERPDGGDLRLPPERGQLAMALFVPNVRTVGPRRCGRRGLTLLEVIVAMAIFLVALAALGQLIQFGADRAMETEYQAMALQKAQSKMAELMVGSEALGSQTDSSFANDDTGQWRWSVEADEDEIQKLWHVKVTVYRQLGDGKVEVTLSRYVLDPSVRVGQAQIPGGATSATNGTTSGTTSGTGTTGN